ncbi:MAG: Rrf2 family transcriptional regulator [Proteobacteria bacterium]|nr:Rrf2 family transcriptional regulator [Pseudomonadota bacterium]
MILTTRGRYAIMSIIDMVESGDNKPVSLSAISQRQEISLSYLEQIFAKLRKAGIVTSIKGPGGGYIIENDLDKITAADIIKATGESIKMTRCSSGGGCMSSKAKCKTHNLWHGLEDAIYSYFQSISIDDICHNQVNLKSINIASQG